MARKILHLDLDAFFCAVEENNDPALTGKPFAVGGNADQRGVVASCSYAARMYGVKSAMPMKRAMQLCPNLVVVSSRHSDYSEVSKKVMALVEISPWIEKLSIDEAFIEVTDLPDPLDEIARELQQRINSTLNLPVSIGGATNKLIAKIANDWGKAQNRGPKPPNAITIIHPGEEAKFLSPLPVQSLWGIGPKSAEKLSSIGISTIGELAKTDPSTLKMLFGRFGPDLQRRASGLDDRPVETEHAIKSISNEITFAKDLNHEKQLLQTFRSLAEKVGRRLRKASLAGSTVQIKLRWSDFTTITRQTTLPSATNLDQEIYDTAVLLFKENWVKGRPIRLIGVGVSSLGPPVRQLSLWDDHLQKEAQLLDAVDQLEEKYGKHVVKRAHHLRKNDKIDNQSMDDI